MERLRVAARFALLLPALAQHSAPDCSGAVRYAVAVAAVPQMVRFSAEAAGRAQHPAQPAASAQQAASLPPGELAARDAAVGLLWAADAVGAPQAAQGAEEVLPRAARVAEVAPQQEVRGAEEVLPQVARGAGEVPQQEARVAAVARQAGVEVRRREARGAAGALPWVAPGAPAALPSGVAWVFRRDRLRRPAP
jgi:hypothetical protein